MVFIMVECFWVDEATDLRTIAVIGGDTSRGETLMPSTVQTSDHTGAGNNSGHSRSNYHKIMSEHESVTYLNSYEDLNLSIFLAAAGGRVDWGLARVEYVRG